MPKTVDIGSVNPPDKNVTQLTSVTDTREWWVAKGNGTWYINLGIAGWGEELWGFIENKVISGHVTQVFVPLDFDRQILRRNAIPSSDDHWHWISDDVAIASYIRSPTLTADRLPNNWPNGRQMYLARPQINGFPAAGILIHLQYSGQIKQYLLKDNEHDIYTRRSSASASTFSSWRQVTIA